MERPNRILVSEDNKNWQDIFTRLLTGANYEVRKASNLQETKWQLDRCLFDLVLVDICLDESDETNVDGVETMRMIQLLSEGTQAIVLTGFATVDLAVSAMREFHVFNFLKKESFDQEVFLKEVAEAVKQAQITSTQLSLSQDPLTLFDSVDLEKASAAFRLPLPRLQFMLRNLIMKTGPTKMQNNSAQITGSGSNSLIVLDYWSKAYACRVHLAVGDNDKVAAGTAVILAEIEEGKVRGLVEKIETGTLDEPLADNV
jgi:ActR/RegA family two-component response regulator